MVPPLENPDSSDDRVKAILRDVKLRVTPTRRIILQLLLEAGHPLSVPDLLERVPTAGLTTVYRTVETFFTKEIVHKVRSKERELLFALGPDVKRLEHLHPHFICEECGTVECLGKAYLPEDFSKNLNLETGYHVNYAEVLLHGRCARCQRPA